MKPRRICAAFGRHSVARQIVDQIGQHDGKIGAAEVVAGIAQCEKERRSGVPGGKSPHRTWLRRLNLAGGLGFGGGHTRKLPHASILRLGDAFGRLNFALAQARNFVCRMFQSAPRGSADELLRPGRRGCRIREGAVGRARAAGRHRAGLGTGRCGRRGRESDNRPLQRDSSFSAIDGRRPFGPPGCRAARRRAGDRDAGACSFLRGVLAARSHFSHARAGHAGSARGGADERGRSYSADTPPRRTGVAERSH